MRAFFRAHKKLHIWLLADVLVLAAFLLARHQKAWMNALADHVTTPLKTALGRLWGQVPFSVMEVLYTLAGLAAVAYVVWSVVDVARRGARFRPSRFSLAWSAAALGMVSAVCGGIVLLSSAGASIGIQVAAALAWPWLLAVLAWAAAAVLLDRERRSRAYRAVLGALCAALTVYLVFCLLWGVNYWTDSFQDKSGIHEEAVSVEELTAVTAWFAEKLSETADDVARDENGLFAVSREEILSAYATVYDGAEELFPFLEFEDQPPKAMFYSTFMSAMNFTGVYCPFTGETNLNVDSPACLLPATVAHELAHQRGFASEQECNFLAVLASTTSGDPVYAYSGWLMGYIHLSNALYDADREAWRTIRDGLPQTVLTDLTDNNAYWARYKGAAATAGQTVYDTVLKAYGDADGIQSYGTVVDLLTVYYRDAALAQ